MRIEMMFVIVIVLTILLFFLKVYLTEKVRREPIQAKLEITVNHNHKHEHIGKEFEEPMKYDQEKEKEDLTTNSMDTFIRGINEVMGVTYEDEER